MSSGGGGTNIQYAQSPEQAQLYQAIAPMVQGLANYGTNTYFSGAPNMGAPSMSGVLSGVPMYNIPDPSLAMPTTSWWNSLAPNVKAGLYAPYEEAGRGMLELLGSQGQAGNARGGYTGAAGAAMGNLAAEAGKNVGLQAWQMTSPMAQMAWGEELARNKSAYGNTLQERTGDYNTAMQAWQMPMSLTGMLGQAMPQAYAQPQSNPWGGALSGAMMGGLGGYAMTGNPWVGGLGALGGGLAGYFGG